MQTLLVRLKSYDPRRGHVLRRYTFAGIKFQHDRGWYRVEEAVGKYLKGVRQVHGDEYSQLAFDVCTEQEAKELETSEANAAKVEQEASAEIKVSPARPAVTTAELPSKEAPKADTNTRSKRERS
ncbi:MAG: hypothetical protein AB7K71_36220 [Polyangiaceae bacterium]